LGKYKENHEDAKEMMDDVEEHPCGADVIKD